MQDHTETLRVGSQSSQRTTSGGTMKRVMLTMMLLASVAVAQTLPAGTALKVKLENNLTTFSNKAGDPFSGRGKGAGPRGGENGGPIGRAGHGGVEKNTQPRRICGERTHGMVSQNNVFANDERAMLD